MQRRTVIGTLAVGFALMAAYASGQVITNPQIAVPIGCAYNTVPPTLTNGQAGWVQCSNNGSLNISGSISASTSAKATAAAPSYVEGTDNPLSMDLAGGLRVLATVDTTGLATAAKQDTGNASLATIASNTGAAIPAGTALIGKVGVDQTTPGTTNGVAIVGVNAATALAGNGATGTGSQRVTLANDNTIPTGWPTSAKQDTGNASVATIATQTGPNAYETVAASQTGQALGATGATGDYLSHCVIYPTTTTPGVVTVFDNTSTAGTNVIAFPGGASSVSNLVPISIPVGAISTAGAWKVTTGANLVVTCYGRFT